MRVLLALDKFKHALGAPAACAAAASAVRAAGAEADEAPLSDGGEGFAEILTRAAGGKLLTHPVLGPRFEPVSAQYGEVDLQKIPSAARARLDLPGEGRLIILEMAQASGLHLLAPAARDPWHASSYGTGQLLARAADTGARAVLLGIGGSATNDLGLGALEAVGLEFRDASAGPLTRVTPARFAEILRLAGETWPHLPDLRLACDVTNPLVGPIGATATYGPQKGLLAEDFPKLERAVGAMAKKICAHFDQPRTLMMEPGAGAAGGIAFGLRAACAARLVPGGALVADWLNLAERVRAADLVVTGEGRFDTSSLAGKVPGLVADLALRLNKKLLVLAGSVDETAAILLRNRAPAGQVTILALSAPGEPPETAYPATAERIARKIKEAL
ncbi:MAG: glycerate kinase [Opitutales bacterium]|jgi:glycerate kinase